MADGAAAVLRQGAKLKHRAANLLALRGSKVLHRLIALQNAVSLLRGHAVQLAQPIAHSLLRLGGKLVKSGLTLKRALLLRNRQVAVTAHPLGEMLLVAGSRRGVPRAVISRRRSLRRRHDVRPGKTMLLCRQKEREPPTCSKVRLPAGGLSGRRAGQYSAQRKGDGLEMNSASTRC